MELESREQCCELPQRQVAGNRPEKQRSCPFTASALHVTARKDRKEECFFCHSQKHSSRSCTADLSLATKKEHLARDRRCFRCTTKGHQARNCRARLSCASCHGRHATTTCDPSFKAIMQPRVHRNNGLRIGPGSSVWREQQRTVERSF
ncbi:hypothetical protein HPB48_026784 [Haemaphysalis longicornis]|uniref:CCHC-type domain-containing protein n=1 Tax=Haemaphysalis longicornis TaxID=44386 RepID=A0A9J6HAL8_HAELO|nr:hypothetical protein HPB48_026784 [Haemaphysalis longicornis]